MSILIIKNINATKIKLNLTLKEIAFATEVSDATVCRYLGGLQNIPDYWIERFCTAFHVSVEWLKTG